MSPGLNSLRVALEAISPLNDRDWQGLEAQARHTSFASGAHLQLAGEMGASLFFLTHGIVREYYTRSDGSERIRSFARSGNFTAAYADFLLHRPAQISIQALQDTQVVAVPLAALETLRTSRSFEGVARRLLEQMYIQKEKREFQFLTMTPTERYRHLEEDFPALEQVIQQYHIASYLGITPVALSRIRRRGKPPAR